MSVHDPRRSTENDRKFYRSKINGNAHQKCKILATPITEIVGRCLLSFISNGNMSLVITGCYPCICCLRLTHAQHSKISFTSFNSVLLILIIEDIGPQVLVVRLTIDRRV
ncbi:Uncharacterized protein FWK35_00016406 [Aphis craccivora]|uniref:Uncharacterized protein n=1 Tax=Aphis craccivora TaxID=307492 RepID=A0A6G0ZF64_APHCR|nr:Uncharacterized protein FWK35_00016406 [Aphis craccivora]